MKPLLKILAYLGGVIFLGALLAPPLFWVGHWLAAQGIMPFLAETELGKFFNRAVLVAAVVLLWPTMRWTGLRGFNDLGLERDTRRGRHLTVGFLAAFVLMVLLGACLLAIGVYKLKAQVPWGAFGKIATTSIVVSLLEEALFRGAILGLLKKTLRTWPAIFFTSALFSVVHFLSPPDQPLRPESVEWFSGFQLVPQAFWQFSEPMLVLAGFTTLFCVGWILAYATVKTRSLWMAIGLHSGWILGTMGFSKMTKRVMKDTLPWFGADLTVGLASVFVVAVTGALIWVWLNYVERNSSTRD